MGQRSMQAASDIFLGWTTRAGAQRRHFFIRQLKDAKIEPVVEVMKPSNLKGYAQLCGMALARTGYAAVLAGYMGKSTAFEDSFADFAVAYADQNELDFVSLVNAVRNCRIEAHLD